jgi:hypothetical protein
MDKTCTRCGEPKSANEFSFDDKKRGLRKAVCKACCSRADKIRYAQNPEPAKERARQQRLTRPEEMKAYDAAYHLAHREERNARASQWVKDHRDVHDAQGRAWRQDNPRKSRGMFLKSKYGLTLEAWDAMLIVQCGRCAGCGRFFENTPLEPSVDHDHETGMVRELVCAPCNHTIGYAEEDIERLLGLVEYLRRHMAATAI